MFDRENIITELCTLYFSKASEYRQTTAMQSEFRRYNVDIINIPPIEVFFSTRLNNFEVLGDGRIRSCRELHYPQLRELK